MDVARLRLLALILGMGMCFPAQSLGQEKAKAKETAFAKTVASLNGGCAMQLSEFWHFPHFTSWGRLKNDGFPAEFQKRFTSVPSDLMKALSDVEGEDYETAASFLAFYCSLARNHAARLGEKNLFKAADRALDPHTGKIRKRLAVGLSAKSNKVRMYAALTLLSLDETHPKATEALKSGRLSENAALVSKACQLIGFAQLASPQAIDYLRKSIRHRDVDVREEAAGAVITMGKSARKLVPALIDYLKTGNDAHGSYHYPLTIGLSDKGNLALMALEAMGTHGEPAVPTILSLFPKATEADQLAMLACLASSGSTDDACLTLVRRAVDHEKPKVRMTAACALLHLAPGDRQATKLMKQAISDKATQKLAVEVCQVVGPPSKEIAASLLPLLDSKGEDERISGTYALASIGPAAKEAVAKIAMLLGRDEDGMKHTFRSSRAAAHALGKIGGKEAAEALLHAADSKGSPWKASGARYAMIYLPVLADDLPPTTLALLVRIMEGKDRQKDRDAIFLTILEEMAAITLSNLGERARPVRRDMERLLDDPQVGWILDTALRRIPVDGGK